MPLNTDDTSTIKITCIHCKKLVDIGITNKQYFDFMQSSLPIQKFFPSVAPAIRELFISRICGVCFDSLFKEEKEKTES